MNKLFKINEKDTVAVALCDLKAGYTENGITLRNDVPFGHKVMLKETKAGQPVLKYGYPIGLASADISVGDHVHSHNLRTDLGGDDRSEYSFKGNFSSYLPKPSGITFSGYEREDGSVGIRNEIWIIPTVGCVNRLCENLKKAAIAEFGVNDSEIKVFSHPYGCSQMGDDLKTTQKILSSLSSHPNAAGILIVSLGCENNNLNEFKPMLGDFNRDRIKFLIAQNEKDELSAGTVLLKELLRYKNSFKRVPVPAEKLKIGLKCGGSDAFSGITANALCGRITDFFTNIGAACVLTETPEMFGAETLLMARAENEKIFKDTVAMINGFKDYFTSHNQPVYENPSPGNKAGGITTLEEKSLGCVQKGGNAAVTRVLNYGEKASDGGLQLLTSPGNDIVSTTALTAAGAHIILFTTGRGTPLGAPVPTVKISSNSPLASKKPGWIDFDAGVLLNGKDFDTVKDSLVDLIIKTASGEKTKNEKNGIFEFAVWKNGVTM